MHVAHPLREQFGLCFGLSELAWFRLPCSWLVLLHLARAHVSVGASFQPALLTVGQ